MPKTEIVWPHAPPHRLSVGGAYFVTVSTYQKQPFFRGRERLEVLHRGLLKVLGEGGWHLEAWAVFSNHYHFVANTEDASNLGVLIKSLHTKLSRWINGLDGTPGRKVWHNYHETHLTFEQSYFARLHYTHINAVKHGLVAVAKDYPWCSAAWFERVAPPSHIKTVYGFKIDKVSLDDSFEVDVAW